ncbi:MAG TPA: hypothetical protein VNT79_14530 [Phycisphaerae bacterium]|nr:hypothetical protein [Phycisphaerae bacterium]
MIPKSSSNPTPRSLGLLLIIPVLAYLIAPLAGCNTGGNKRIFESRKSSSEYLKMAMEAEKADDRRRGVVGLANSPDATSDWAVKVFDTIARTDVDAMVRSAALRALAPAVDPPRVETCVKLLTSESETHEGIRKAPPVVRWSAANLLLHAVRNGAVSDEQHGAVIETLIARVQSEKDVGARLAMTEALGYFPKKKVLETLVAILLEENFTIRHAAEVSLALLTGVTHDHDPEAWRQWLAQNPDPFAGAGQLPDSLARENQNKNQWDWLGTME